MKQINYALFLGSPTNINIISIIRDTERDRAKRKWPGHKTFVLDEYYDDEKRRMELLIRCY